jgi:hypothetical protein
MAKSAQGPPHFPQIYIKCFLGIRSVKAVPAVTEFRFLYNCGLTKSVGECVNEATRRTALSIIAADVAFNEH